MEFIKNNKIKLAIAALVFGLGVATYFGFEQLAVESKACLEANGKLEYNRETQTLECVLPNEYKWWPF